MSFLEDFLVSFGQEILFGLLKWIGISIKWLFYLGKKPISQIKKEDWNNRIGFSFFILIIGFIIYFLNK